MTYDGKMVPLAPPSGISLFFSDCVDEIVVFVEQQPLINREVLPVPRHNNPNTPRNITEVDMESTEIVPVILVLKQILS
jgi:hypothetical protein